MAPHDDCSGDGGGLGVHARTRAATFVTRRGLAGHLLALAAFGAALGLLEAVVIIYLKHVVGIPTPANLDRAVLAGIPEWIVSSEQAREVAMLVMLVTLAYLAGRRPRERVAAFLFTLGLVDLSFYASIKLLLDWPATLQTTDLVVLIPAPWFAPVWAPMTIAAVMILAGLGMMAAGRKR